MDKRVRETRQTERGNTRGGATKERDFTDADPFIHKSTLLSMYGWRPLSYGRSPFASFNFSSVSVTSDCSCNSFPLLSLITHISSLLSSSSQERRLKG